MNATEKRNYRRFSVKLKAQDRKILRAMQSKGVESVRTLKRAMVLLRMDEGLSPNKAAAAIGVTPETARMWGWRYVKEGLDAALFDRLRPGNPPLLNNKQATHIIAIACSPPPDGVAFWSTAMLAEEAIKRKIVKSISRETVRVLLKNHDLKP